ncbi:hypothetical protein B0A50_06776 [Salinomyces thailandicus]|uniref:RRM domain-containing protein n=1 Tax=Salinomyces thailandicus TaxID=706561 RepID=A0A4U0TQX0_9PEZI|nr:hypothetical protein B0A50_06776 [Salinomyces thailandica]
MYSRTAHGSAGVSPPNGSYRSDSQLYASNLPTDRHSADRYGSIPSLSASTSDPSAYGADIRPAPAIIIRRLPRSIGAEALGSMLIFAGDLIDTEFIRSPYSEDNGYATAVARFASKAGAMEAQQKLNGKSNKDTQMVVEVHIGGTASSFERRNTIDGLASRTQTSSSSSGGSVAGPPGRSRYGSSFQSPDKVSPPLPTATSGEFPIPETSAHFQNLFSPHSPLANGVHDRHRVSGKSIINDDSADDETGDLLKDPVAYARNGQQPTARRLTNPQVPVSRFGSLSLSTADGSGLGTPATAGMTSPRSISAMQSPTTALSPTSTNGMGQNGGYGGGYSRAQYPPVNPADQNPPCNTLYVGNLPVDTSEDELKTIFSKQRGYKRLCFRTKQNGPMCFVEFEDVSFATKTLNDLYGFPLHNSIKGGIRLSFSKNPLGVRSTQMNGVNGVMNPQAMAPGYIGAMPPGGFSAASGPPPGLAMPPGLSNGNGYHSQPSTGMDSMFTNPFSMPSPEFSNQLNPRAVSGGVPAPLGTGTFGRDTRHSYSDYALGR